MKKNTIIISLYDGLGDYLYSSIITEILLKEGLEIYLLTNKIGKEFFKYNKNIVVYTSILEALKEKYDILIDLSFKGKSYLYSLLIRSNLKLGMYKKNREKALKFIYNKLKKFENKDNEILNTAQVLEPIIDINKYDNITPAFYFPKKENPFIKLKPYILVTPFAKVKTKEWEIHKFYELSYFLKEKGFNIIFSYPNSMESFIEKKKDFYYFSGTIHEFANILKDANGLISTEGFPYHLAGALGVPSFTILGAYPPWRVFQNQFFFYKGLYCQFCGKKECPLGHLSCLKDLNFSDIKLALENFITHL